MQGWREGLREGGREEKKAGGKDRRRGRDKYLAIYYLTSLSNIYFYRNICNQ